MTKTLNLKILAQSMNVQDKARLIFANLQSQEGARESNRLLTSAEEEAIYADARRHNQIRELNRLIQLYNLSMFAAVDVKTAMLCLELQLAYFDLHIAIMSGELSLEDRLDELLYLAQQNETKTNKLMTEAIEKIKNRSKPITNLFNPETLEEEKMEPDLLLQKQVAKIVDASKRLKQNLYVVEYLSQQGGMDFLSEGDQALVNDAKELLEKVINPEGFLVIVGIYKEFADNGRIKTEGLAEPRFLEFMLDPKKSVTLTEAEQKSTEERAERIIRRHF